MDTKTSQLLERYVPPCVWNPTAARQAFVIALVLAPLWAFLMKPLFHVYKRQENPLHIFIWTLLRSIAPPLSPALTWANSPTPNQAKPKKGRGTLNGHIPQVEPQKRYATSDGPVTRKALDELLRSPGFEKWYSENRQSLMERIRVRNAQSVWASIAALVVLGLGAFFLPLFSFSNEGKTLFVVLRPLLKSPTLETGVFRDGKNIMGVLCHVLAQLSGVGHTLLVLAAAFTLLTTSLMPVFMRQTAVAALISVVILIAEAARFERMAAGAGFMLLWGLVAWRVARAFG